MRIGIGIGLTAKRMGGISQYDPDAAAFMTVLAIPNDGTVFYPSTPQQRTGAQLWNYINTLVVSLKAAGLWSLAAAIYPFIGGTSLRHRYNLKNPANTNAAFRIIFAGGITHDALGVKGNGTNGSAQTNYNTSNNTANQFTWGTYFTQGKTSDNKSRGCEDNVASYYLNNPNSLSANAMYYGYTAVDINFPKTITGMNSITRNGTAVATKTGTNAPVSGVSAVGTNPNQPLDIIARYTAGVNSQFTDPGLGLETLFPGSLTTQQQNDLHTIGIQYQTDLGRAF